MPQVDGNGRMPGGSIPGSSEKLTLGWGALQLADYLAEHWQIVLLVRPLLPSFPSARAARAAAGSALPAGARRYGWL